MRKTKKQYDVLEKIKKLHADKEGKPFIPEELREHNVTNTIKTFVGNGVLEECEGTFAGGLYYRWTGKEID